MATEIKKIISRRDTAAKWEANNPILAQGEIGVDTTNKVMKIGDGVTPWKSLKGVGGVEIVNDLTTGGADKALSAEMGKELNKVLSNIDNNNVILEDNNITVTTDSGDIVGVIDENGADFIGLKKGGKEVATEDYVEQLSETKVEKAELDEIITKGKAGSIKDEIKFIADNNEEIASISQKDGIKAKRVQVLHNGEYVDVYADGKLNTELKYGEIIIPKDIYIAKGRECNLWWSSIANVKEGDNSIYFETTCNVGRNCTRGFVINSNANEGDYELRIVSRQTSTRKIVSDVKTNIHIVPASVGSGNKSICMMGDSRTWQSFGGINGSQFSKGGNKTITTETKSLIDATQTASFSFIGHEVSAVDNSVRNLAISGAAFSYPLNVFNNNIDGCKNYMENNGLQSGASLSFATIMYGINDLSDWDKNVIGQYDVSIDKIPKIIANAKKLVDVILGAYPNCKILMVVEPTTCASQDGWGYWGGDKTMRHSAEEMEKAQKLLRKKILESFDNFNYSPNVIISSAGLWCDRIYGFPYLMRPVSSRTSKLVEQFQECVHPFDDGYKQIADGIFSTIAYISNN